MFFYPFVSADSFLFGIVSSDCRICPTLVRLCRGEKLERPHIYSALIPVQYRNYVGPGDRKTIQFSRAVTDIYTVLFESCWSTFTLGGAHESCEFKL